MAILCWTYKYTVCCISLKTVGSKWVCDLSQTQIASLCSLPLWCWVHKCIQLIQLPWFQFLALLSAVWSQSLPCWVCSLDHLASNHLWVQQLDCLAKTLGTVSCTPLLSARVRSSYQPSFNELADTVRFIQSRSFLSHWKLVFIVARHAKVLVAETENRGK